jgi:hypothetical protein
MDAAKRLGISQSRIRAMVKAGLLDGQKVGGRWFVGLDGVRRRERWGPVDGRHLQPENAWAVLTLASGSLPTWIPREDVRRLVQLLDDRGLLGLAPRMGRRAQTHRFYGHPGTLRTLAASPEVRLTGISAARSNDLGIVGGQQVDAYIAADDLGAFVTRFALEPRSQTGNVSLRALPFELTYPADTPPPPAVVALDLAEDIDPRSSEVGTTALQRLDDDQRWRGVKWR